MIDVFLDWLSGGLEAIGVLSAVACTACAVRVGWAIGGDLLELRLKRRTRRCSRTDPDD